MDGGIIEVLLLHYLFSGEPREFTVTASHGSSKLRRPFQPTKSVVLKDMKQRLVAERPSGYFHSHVDIGEKFSKNI